MGTEVDPALQALIESVTAKRPRRVLDHIVKHGQVTTAELQDLYGYNHPPRAARDVRELGIPLVTTRVTGPDGRKIAAYRLGQPEDARGGRAGGRQAFPKSFKDRLIERDGLRCSLCGSVFPARALQIDHRIPYEVGGEPDDLQSIDGFMLVCGSCNRSKSWSCEQCENWAGTKSVDVCRRCYWAEPQSYEHLALVDRRTLVLTWDGEHTKRFDALAERAAAAGQALDEFVRALLDELGE